MKTVLYERHAALRAKFGPFGGWKLSLYYKGSVAEHMAVRNWVSFRCIIETIEVEIRGRRVKAEVVKLPLVTCKQSS